MRRAGKPSPARVQSTGRETQHHLFEVKECQRPIISSNTRTRPRLIARSKVGFLSVWDQRGVDIFDIHREWRRSGALGERYIVRANCRMPQDQNRIPIRVVTRRRTLYIFAHPRLGSVRFEASCLGYCVARSPSFLPLRALDPHV